MKDRTRGKTEDLEGKARQAVGNLKRAARDVRGDLHDEAERTRREQHRAGVPYSR